MKRLFEGISNHLDEIFQYYVYFAGFFVADVLAINGHIIAAIMQGIIWVGYMYGCHYASQEKREYARLQEKSAQLQKSLDEERMEHEVALKLLTNEQLHAYWDEIYKK